MNVTDVRLFNSVQPWIEGQLGFPLSDMAVDTVPVLAADPKISDPPLRALRVGERAAIVARPVWVGPLKEIANSLHPDLLFSVFGAYELSRITLPDGVGVWGPVWYLFADRTCLRPPGDIRPVRLEPSDLADVDYRLFWHCSPESLAGFGVFDRDRLIALATVWDVGNPVWEIGMDVLPDAKGTGLGRAVVAAAARWIVENGRLVLATTASFNVPSARTLRAVGLRYLFSALNGTEGLMNLPPQPLGLPYPDATVHNLYPEWAMNKVIRPKPGS